MARSSLVLIALLTSLPAVSGELNPLCVGTFTDLGAATRAVSGGTDGKLLLAMETLAAEVDSLPTETVIGLLQSIENKIYSGKYRFASDTDSFRADEALLSLGFRDEIDLAAFPRIRERLEMANSPESAFRRHIRSIFDAYPELWVAIPKWKAEARAVLKRDLELKRVENPDLFARSLVNKIERQARSFDARAEFSPVDEGVYAFLKAGKGGKINRTTSITGDACAAAKAFDVSVSKKLAGWIDAVEKRGMAAIRQLPGYHDHPLKGELAGQRSVYLTRSYRAIYVEKLDGTIEIVKVTKHDYRTN